MPAEHCAVLNPASRTLCAGCAGRLRRSLTPGSDPRGAKLRPGRRNGGSCRTKEHGLAHRQAARCRPSRACCRTTGSPHLHTRRRLQPLADLYGAVAQSAAKRKDASYADFLEEVLKGERDARRVRAREMLTRIAGFPALKTLEAYDFAFASGAPRQQIQELAGLGF